MPFAYRFSIPVFVDPDIQSCLLIIDTIILPGVVSTEGTDLVQSLLKLNRNIYQPVPTPEFIPADFGEASRIQHLINVALTALCNCKNFLPLVASFLF
jgi:hypothetical protein